MWLRKCSTRESKQDVSRAEGPEMKSAMRTFLVLCVVIMLAVPTLSRAGGATNRWDLTIGGMLTDTAWPTFYYGQVQTNTTTARRNQISTSAVDRNQQYSMVNFIAGPNPAIRLGFEYAYNTTHDARNTNAFDPANPSSTAANGLQNKGTPTVVRFAAQYFF